MTDVAVSDEAVDVEGVEAIVDGSGSSEGPVLSLSFCLLLVDFLLLLDGLDEAADGEEDGTVNVIDGMMRVLLVVSLMPLVVLLLVWTKVLLFEDVEDWNPANCTRVYCTTRPSRRHHHPEEEDVLLSFPASFLLLLVVFLTPPCKFVSIVISECRSAPRDSI